MGLHIYFAEKCKFTHLFRRKIQIYNIRMCTIKMWSINKIVTNKFYNFKISPIAYVYSYWLLYEKWRFLKFVFELNDFKRDDHIYARHTRFPTRFSYLAFCSRSKRESTPLCVCLLRALWCRLLHHILSPSVHVSSTLYPSRDPHGYE